MTLRSIFYHYYQPKYFYRKGLFPSVPYLFLVTRSERSGIYFPRNQGKRYHDEPPDGKDHQADFKQD